MEEKGYIHTKLSNLLKFLSILFLFFLSFGVEGQIYSESFDALDGKGQDGTTLDTASVNNAWIIDKTGGSFSSGDWFKVVTASSRFEARDTDGAVDWFTPVIDISTYVDVEISVDLGYVTSHSSHSIYVSASIDGGSFIDIGSLQHNGGPTANISASGLIGSSLQVRVRVTTTYSSYTWYIDNVTITGTSGYTHETLTPGTTTWTSPAGVTSVKAYAWGAGGGGGYGGSTGGAGGGGGAFAMNTLTVSESTSYDCFIGTGGTGGIQSTTTSATNGGISWLSLTGVAPTNTSEGVLAAGGTAGGNNTSSTSAGGTTGASYGATEYAGGTSGGGGSSGGGSGAGAGGFLSIGSNGTTGYNGTGSADKTGGLSGLTPIGDGQGGTGSGTSNGTSGTLPGGGGGGANDAAGFNGGAGGDGRIILAYLSVAPLPVKLISFDAIPQQKTVELKWVTATEKNSSYFEIEKSIDGEYFEVIGKVEAAGTSYDILTYSELDRNPTQGISYYRLKQFDLDGSFTTSDMKSVVYGSKSSNKLIPNPSNGMFVTLILKGTSYQKSEAGTISIINELGQVVHKEEVQMNSISFTMTPSSRLSPGYYSVVVMQGGKRIASEKMVVNW